MALESVRAFLQVAMGVGETTRSRAVDAAQGLLGLAAKAAPGDVGPVVTALADDLMAAAAANRELVLELVRTEVSTILQSSAGLVPGADLDAVRGTVGHLTEEVDSLRRQISVLAPWLGEVGSAAVAAVSALPGAPTHAPAGADGPPSRLPAASASGHGDRRAATVRRTPSRPGPGARRRMAAAAAEGAQAGGTAQDGEDGSTAVGGKDATATRSVPTPATSGGPAVTRTAASKATTKGVTSKATASAPTSAPTKRVTSTATTSAPTKASRGAMTKARPTTGGTTKQAQPDPADPAAPAAPAAPAPSSDRPRARRRKPATTEVTGTGGPA